MNNINVLKIRDWLISQNIENIWEEIYNIKKRWVDANNYIIMSSETIQFWKKEQLDLLTLEIFWVESRWPNVVEQIADNILDIFPWEDLIFDWFKVYQILPTWKTPTFTLQNQFKVTLFFQVRYLI